MVREIRNLDGEVVAVLNDRSSSHSEQTGPVSWGTIALVFGIALLLRGIFPEFLSSMLGIVVSFFRVFDVRLWAWWYYPIVIVAILSGIRLLRLHFAAYSDNFREYDPEEAHLFKRMSLFISVGMVLFLFAHLQKWLIVPLWYLNLWLGKGTFSWMALGTFVLLCLFIGISFYLIKTWAYHYFAERD